jgi:protocatechuate 3,4-dioxygenase beta subunit
MYDPESEPHHHHSDHSPSAFEADVRALSFASTPSFASEPSLLSRRRLLTRGLTAAVAAGLGLDALSRLAAPAFGSSLPSATAANGLALPAGQLATPSSCTLTCASTIGPCYYDSQLIRQDIREGVSGLSTLLSFLVVNADTCQPVSNASIDLWHANAAGVYSAPINTMCNGNDLAARQARFLRGIQFTGSDGWAHFQTVYPGWYSGRTTHIHLTVRVGGSEMVTTQLFFDDTFNSYIYQNFAPYTSRPNKDTANLRDNVIGGSASRVTPFLFDTKLINGKTLVARKVLAIRTTKTTCSA